MDSQATAALIEVGQLIPELLESIRAVSRRSLDWFRQPLQIESKVDTNNNPDRGEKATYAASNNYDPVTVADRTVEDLLTSYLTRQFPNIGIYGEERGSSGPEGLRWVIDPIDGTRSFVTGRPMWGTLVSLEVEGEPLIGFLHVPTMDETYWAISATAARWLKIEPSAHIRSPAGERALSVSSATSLSEARLASTDPRMFAPGAEQESYLRVADACGLVRFDGDCYNYALLASGNLDLVVENQLERYDISALIPLVRSSGGVISGPNGDSPNGGGYVIAAATEALHAQVLSVLAES